MKIEQLLKSENAALLLEWIEKCTPDEEYASLLDAAEENTRKKKEVDELILILFVLEMNVRASKNYGYYYHYLKKSGKMIEDRDILIASIALSFGENRIVTRNIKHFERIEELEMVSY
jgi:predicted nucleic acid-binding protein